MDSLLPLLPLEIVVFPKEKLPLHIFEDRYKQLIKDCTEGSKSFGIPAYIDNSMKYGTEMRLLQVVKTYPNGAADVICEATEVFRIREFFRKFPEKPYAGARVEFVENINDGSVLQKEILLELIVQLYKLLGVPAPPISIEKIDSFILSHKIGLSIHQEYELLKTSSEAERLSLLINHLKVAIPLVREINRTQQVIEMNGHFKNFDPLDFEDFKLD